MHDRANINIENCQKVPHISIEQTHIFISNIQQRKKLSTIKKVTKKSHWLFIIYALTYNQIYFILSHYAYTVETVRIVEQQEIIKS